ncbi:MAG: YqgE/AlgH family protein [Pseudomonadota bacterium]
MTEEESAFFDGRLLIAMPGATDSRFDRSVIYMCAHSADGAMGVIVNKPAHELKFSDLLEQLEIAPSPGMRDLQVHFGGPVDRVRGFILHGADYRSEESTLDVNEHFAMTGTRDILRAIADGGGPKEALLVLGYAGWGPGQLEGEIRAHAWLVADADPELVFETEDEEKWDRAVGGLGIDPAQLSGAGGRA